MKIRKSLCTGIAVAAVGVASVMTGTVGAPVAVASPLEVSAAEAAAQYRAKIQDGSLLAEIDAGTFTVDAVAGTAALRDAAGAVLDTVPLSYAFDSQLYRIDAQVSADGRALRLTPQLPAGRTAAPIASPVENQLAMNDLINSVSFGLSAGALVGTIVGAVLGIGAGLAVSGAACVVVSIGCVLAVVPIVTLLGGVGGLAGMALGGAPGLVNGLWNYYSTINAAPGQSQYAGQLPAFNTPAPSAEGGQ